MIISFQYNFIYFRPKKTGSSTIVDVLRPCLGGKDISRGKDVPDHPEVQGRTHVTAAEIKKIVPPEFWNSAFKFASERHPYEKAVSLVYFRLGKQREKREKTRRSSRKRFPTILDRIVANGEYRGFEYYSIDGVPVVDEFIRFETLEADLRRVGARLGIPVPDELPRSKSGFRLKQKPARDILSYEQKCTVFEKCREEFELLGYER